MSNTEASREPKHTPGHGTNVARTKENEFMCPECGKTFDNTGMAERHLHSEHWEHLRTVHGEFHSKDTEMEQKEQ